MQIRSRAARRALAVLVGATIAFGGTAAVATAAPTPPAAVQVVKTALPSNPVVKYDTRNVTAKASSMSINKLLTVDRPGTVSIEVRSGWWPFYSWRSISGGQVTKAGTYNFGLASFNKKSSNTYRLVFTPNSGKKWTSSEFTVTWN